jgi:hypothetical protein
MLSLMPHEQRKEIRGPRVSWRSPMSITGGHAISAIETPANPRKTEMNTAQKMVRNKMQDEIFLRLVSAAAAEGGFNLGKLKSAKEAQSHAKHLKGVAEIIATTYQGEAE